MSNDMHPGANLYALVPGQFEVHLHRQYCGVVYTDFGVWFAVDDQRGYGEPDAFDTRTEAVNWLCGW